jgi:hypothetical protein
MNLGPVQISNFSFAESNTEELRKPLGFYFFFIWSKGRRLNWAYVKLYIGILKYTKIAILVHIMGNKLFFCSYNLCNPARGV